MIWKRIIWILVIGMTSIQGQAQASLPLEAGVLPESALCPVEWVNQIAQLEYDQSAFVSVRPRGGIPFGSPREHFRFQTDAIASVFLTDPRAIHPTEVVLEGLLGDGLRLEGPYVRVGSERLDGPSDAAPGKNGPDYRFLPDTSVALHCSTDISVCSPFDAVNVYYHLDQFARKFWIERMGVPIAFQADAKVHVVGDGAFARAEGNVLKFRLGDIFMKNAALSNDLIYHEYAHLVAASLGFNPNSEHSAEARALSEAYADYFTATYTNGPRIGDWVVTCPDRQACIGPPNDREIRTLVLDPSVWSWKFGFPNPDLQYGFCLRYHQLDGKCKAAYNNFANHYVWGMIWAATLWDLRAQLGADVVDRLALTALGQHTVETQFSEATVHVLAADAQLFGGQHESIIREAFWVRGFYIPVNNNLESPIDIAISHLEVWPNPASNVIRVSFESDLKSAASIQLHDVLGRQILKRDFPYLVGPRQTSIDINGLPGGIYILSLSSGTKTVSLPVSVIH